MMVQLISSRHRALACWLCLLVEYFGRMSAAPGHAQQGVWDVHALDEKIETSQKKLLTGTQPRWFAALGSIVGTVHDTESCTAIAISQLYVLSTASCIDGLASSKLLISGLGKEDDNTGWQRGSQGLRIERKHTHPKWVGGAEREYDAALLKVSEPINVAVPVLSAKDFVLAPDARVHGFDVGHGVEIIHLNITANEDGREVSNFCPGSIHSFSSNSNTSAGSPVMILDDPCLQNCDDGGIKSGNPALDLLVGICPVAGRSSRDNSSTACVVISHIRQWIDEVLSAQDWAEVPSTLSGAIASIRGLSREHFCMGTFISSRFLLTSAVCIDAVGPNPIIVVNPRSSIADRWTEGAQEVRAERAYVHPNWTGNVELGYDAAVLELPRELTVPSPQLPPAGFDLYPNSKLHAFRLEKALEMAPFEVVRNDLCPKLHIEGPNTFCAFSIWTTMDSGSAGGPLLMRQIPSAEAEWPHMMQDEPHMDLLVGIVSFANYSSIEESGIGSVLITGIQDWINDIKMEQQNFEAGKQSSLGIMIAIVFVTALVNLLIANRFGTTTLRF